MKTINIKGKEYIEVNERIKYFRANYPDGRIITDIISIKDGVCIFKADIFIGDNLVATGHAYEKEGSTFINKTSYIENCETSAVGRALGILGIGIDTSIASAEEVGNAIANQGKKKNSLIPEQQSLKEREYPPPDYNSDPRNIPGYNQDKVNEISKLVRLKIDDGKQKTNEKWLNFCGFVQSESIEHINPETYDIIINKLNKTPDLPIKGNK